LVGLRVFARNHDPKHHKSGGLLARDSVAVAASLAMDARRQSRAEFKRQLTTIGLTGQMFAGAFLGIAAQAFLAWGIIFHVMPRIGPDLLDPARAVAVLDLPARVAQLFASFLALK